MSLKVLGSQMQQPLMRGRRFIRMTLLRKEIADLQAQGRIIYSGNAHFRKIALTFDDGPDPYYTPQILDILDQYRIKATFFCVGRQVEAYPQVVRQEYEAGHVVGNHSWTHPDLGLLPASDVLLQIKRASNALQEVIGTQPMFFRPPYGSLSNHVLKQACHLGVTTVMWNAGEEARDWLNPGVDFIIRRTLDLICNGSIILLHDCGRDRSQTMAALPVIIQKLQDRGFQFVTIQQMVETLR